MKVATITLRIPTSGSLSHLPVMQTTKTCRSRRARSAQLLTGTILCMKEHAPTQLETPDNSEYERIHSSKYDYQLTATGHKYQRQGNAKEEIKQVPDTLRNNCHSLIVTPYNLTFSLPLAQIFLVESGEHTDKRKSYLLCVLELV